eukprot:m.240906 g.240906  ORF g.240906 m.240906 type:complete len:127 (+) comp19421_c0_seq21:245-625(+)
MGFTCEAQLAANVCRLDIAVVIKNNQISVEPRFELSFRIVNSHQLCGVVGCSDQRFVQPNHLGEITHTRVHGGSRTRQYIRMAMHRGALPVTQAQYISTTGVGMLLTSLYSTTPPHMSYNTSTSLL